MSNKNYININEPIYNLVHKYKEMDIISAIILSDIEHFCKANGYFKKNETISKELNISVATISRKIKTLSDLGYIEIKQVLRGRKVLISEKFQKYVFDEIESKQPNQNDKQPNQNDKQPNQNDKQPNQNDKQPNQNEDVHIRIPLDKQLDTQLENNISELVETLRSILKKYYVGSLSIRFSTDNVTNKLKTKLKEFEFEFIKTGYENYLITMKNEKTELKHIKSCDVFLNQNIFKDYQVLEGIKSSSYESELEYWEKL